MTNETYIPAKALAPFVKEYRIIEADTALVNRVLPNTSLILAFNFRGSVNYLTDKVAFELPQITISGLQRSVRLIAYAARSSTLIVRFTETGAVAFLKYPLQELFEENVALDHLVAPRKVSAIEEQLSSSSNNKERI